MTTNTALAEFMLARPGVGNALDVAFSGLTQSVGEKLSVAVDKWIRTGKTPKRAEIQKELSIVLSTVLADEFIVRLSANDDSSRHRRAAVMALLSASEFSAAGFPAITPEDGGLLTSEQAAELLHVSRTHVNKLMDSGALKNALKTEGGHRRVPKASVIAYRTESKARQANGIKRMVEASQALQLYEAEIAGVPTSPKRRSLGNTRG